MENCNTCQFSYDDQIDLLCPKCGSVFEKSLWDEIPLYVRFLNKISNKTNELLEKLKSENTSNTDKPMLQLGIINIFTIRIIYTLLDYNDLIRYPSSKIPKKFLQDKRNNSSYISEVITGIDIFDKSSYLTMVLFRFEDYFAHEAKELGYTGIQKYWKITEYLVDNSQLSEKEEKFDMLIFPSVIRNMLHKSGVYHGKSQTFNIKKISFEFQNNTEPELLSWRYIIFSLLNILEIVEELLLIKYDSNL